MKTHAHNSTSHLSLIELSAIAILGLTLFWVPNGLANPGDLDPTFGTGGKVITDFGSVDSARDVAIETIQGEERIVAVGGSCCTSGKPKRFSWQLRHQCFGIDERADRRYQRERCRQLF